MLFESLGAVSYSSSIVTIAVPLAVCEIFNVKEWCDHENRVRVRSRSLEMAPFDIIIIIIIIIIIYEKINVALSRRTARTRNSHKKQSRENR